MNAQWADTMYGVPTGIAAFGRAMGFGGEVGGYQKPTEDKGRMQSEVEGLGDTVIVGVLSLLGTLAGSLLGILSANKLTNYRIRQLEVKVDKHNQLSEWKIEAIGRMDLIDEKIEVANHRIADLERD
ncbi:MAG: hypothetical protein RSE58_08540 [Clostridia bacterium]